MECKKTLAQKDINKWELVSDARWANFF